MSATGNQQLEAYLCNIPASRRSRFDSIRRLIVEMYPQAVESMRYKMPTFEYQRGWIALANQKGYISVYTCKADHIAEFKQRYPAIKTGKGCINFRDPDEIPLEDLRRVIRNALDIRYQP